MAIDDSDPVATDDPATAVPYCPWAALFGGLTHSHAQHRDVHHALSVLVTRRYTGIHDGWHNNVSGECFDPVVHHARSTGTKLAG